MPRTSTVFSLIFTLAGLCSVGMAASPPAKTSTNSALDSELFYQVLIGEMSTQAGDNGAGYALLLDAARKSNSPKLYERAVEIAYRARNGEAALDAATAWARAFPSSKDANRYQIQILLGLNKVSETQEPIRRELDGLSPTERVAIINTLPRYFARTADKQLSAAVLEKSLSAELGNRVTGPVAWTAIGIVRLQATDLEGALEAIRKAVALDDTAQEPIMLAIAMLGPKSPMAEVIVQKHLLRKPSTEVRITYARALAAFQRYAEAYTQTVLTTQEAPAFSDAWLMRGSLELQDGKFALAQTSLTTYVSLSPAPPEADSANTMERGLVQAYLMLAQVAEQEQRLDDARAYLAKIVSNVDTLRVQRRQAAILARQGKLEDARELIRSVPETQPSDALDKLNAEVQLLRDIRQYTTAYSLLRDAIARYPDEIELVYDQAMLAERLGKNEEMEALLRKVIQVKPDYHHAYNALGYSLADRNIRLDEARVLVNQALAFAPNDPFIMDSLAWVEFRLGNRQEALRLLQIAFRARPDAEIAAHLGEVLWATGEHEQANAVWKEGQSLNPQNETLQETMRRLRKAP